MILMDQWPFWVRTGKDMERHSHGKTGQILLDLTLGDLTVSIILDTTHAIKDCEGHHDSDAFALQRHLTEQKAWHSPWQVMGCMGCR